MMERQQIKCLVQNLCRILREKWQNLHSLNTYFFSSTCLLDNQATLKVSFSLEELKFQIPEVKFQWIVSSSLFLQCKIDTI